MASKKLIKKNPLVKKGGCTAHYGPRGGRYHMKRKRSGGTERKYLEKGEHLPKPKKGGDKK